MSIVHIAAVIDTPRESEKVWKGVLNALDVLILAIDSIYYDLKSEF